MSNEMKKPGVYIQEQNGFGPASIENATAIPVFVGFTQKATTPEGEPLPQLEGYPDMIAPVLIESLLSYERHFGAADKTGVMTITGEYPDYSAEITRDGEAYVPGYMHPSIQSYYANGGHQCYIVSLGAYHKFKDYRFDMEGFELAIEYAEKSTLLVLTDLIRLGALNYYHWCSQLLTAPQTNKRQFLILDVIHTQEDSVFNKKDIELFREHVTGDALKYGAAYFPYLISQISYEFDEAQTFYKGTSLKDYGTTDNDLYHQLNSFLTQNYINMPPASAIAGIYHRVDNHGGVWKPPANVALNGVVGPLVNLTNHLQEELNIEAVSGKSINAIRSFTGEGILVWGARTLDANSLDWKYVNVRRFFNSLETDITTALQGYVFEPNNQNTWMAVKRMIDAYLRSLFRQGAFAGDSPDASYQVDVGVGATMTTQDVLEGLMKVSIQVAPVRPNEFIELLFTQKMSE